MVTETITNTPRLPSHNSIEFQTSNAVFKAGLKGQAIPSAICPLALGEDVWWWRPVDGQAANGPREDCDYLMMMSRCVWIDWIMKHGFRGHNHFTFSVFCFRNVPPPPPHVIPIFSHPSFVIGWPEGYTRSVQNTLSLNRTVGENVILAVTHLWPPCYYVIPSPPTIPIDLKFHKIRPETPMMWVGIWKMEKMIYCHHRFSISRSSSNKWYSESKKSKVDCTVETIFKWKRFKVSRHYMKPG